MKGSVSGTIPTVAGMVLALLMANVTAFTWTDIYGLPALCDNNGSKSSIAKSDCDSAALQLEKLGQSGKMCGPNKDKHDENGCTGMISSGTCNANVCDWELARGMNCADLAQFVRYAYNGCTSGSDTLPAASYQIPDGPLVSVTYSGRARTSARP